jgi:hypothetical protein
VIFYGLALAACGGGGGDDDGGASSASGSFADCFSASRTVNYRLDMPFGTVPASYGPGIFQNRAAVMWATYLPDGAAYKIYWAVTSNSVITLGSIDSDGTVIPSNPADNTMPFMRPGDYYDTGYYVDSDGEPVRPSRTTFVGFETLTLAGRKFTNVCHFRDQDLLDNGNLDPSDKPDDIWSAPEYGPIRHVTAGVTVEYEYAGER